LKSWSPHRFSHSTVKSRKNIAALSLAVNMSPNFRFRLLKTASLVTLSGKHFAKPAMSDAAFLVLLLSSGAASVGPLHSQASPRIDGAFLFAYASSRSEAFGEFFAVFLFRAPPPGTICATQIEPEPVFGQRKSKYQLFRYDPFLFLAGQKECKATVNPAAPLETNSSLNR
jgi:hypothetical protein